ALVVTCRAGGTLAPLRSRRPAAVGSVPARSERAECSAMAHGQTSASSDSEMKPFVFKHSWLVIVFAMLVAPPSALFAQRGQLTASDSALVGRILLAEDRRDSTDASLAAGLKHADGRVRMLARRAMG